MKGPISTSSFVGGGRACFAKGNKTKGWRSGFAAWRAVECRPVVWGLLPRVLGCTELMRQDRPLAGYCPHPCLLFRSSRQLDYQKVPAVSSAPRFRVRPSSPRGIVLVHLRFPTSGIHHSQDAAHSGITQAVDMER